MLVDDPVENNTTFSRGIVALLAGERNQRNNKLLITLSDDNNYGRHSVLAIYFIRDQSMGNSNWHYNRRNIRNSRSNPFVIKGKP